MATIWETMWRGYNYIFYELQDIRTRDTFPSVISLAAILVTYLYFCKSLGPRLMKDRRPFELKSTILLYNIFQIFISLYLIYMGLFYGGWLYEYNWTCQPVDYTNSVTATYMHSLTWMYLMVKLIELLDTVFFVLRKKSRQVSALHLYHHFLMPICAFIALKYYPNGHSTSLGLVNTFVHVIMYSYYLIAGLGPQFQKHLWWKKYVTILQLVQFLIIFCHNMIPLIYIDCNYPKWINFGLSVSSLHFVYMFGNFYYKTYIEKADIGNGARVMNGKFKKH